MTRKHAMFVFDGDVLEELGPKLVIRTTDSWDGGVMLTWLDLLTGEIDNSFFGSYDLVDQL